MNGDVGGSAWGTMRNIPKWFLNTEKWFPADAPSLTIETWAFGVRWGFHHLGFYVVHDVQHWKTWNKSQQGKSFKENCASPFVFKSSV